MATREPRLMPRSEVEIDCRLPEGVWCVACERVSAHARGAGCAVCTQDLRHCACKAGVHTQWDFLQRHICRGVMHCHTYWITWAMLPRPPSSVTWTCCLPQQPKLRAVMLPRLVGHYQGSLGTDLLPTGRGGDLNSKSELAVCPTKAAGGSPLLAIHLPCVQSHTRSMTVIMTIMIVHRSKSN